METAWAALLDDLRREMGVGNVSLWVLLDRSEAFNTI